jgi:hypothetical protein
VRASRIVVAVALLSIGVACTRGSKSEGTPAASASSANTAESACRAEGAANEPVVVAGLDAVKEKPVVVAMRDDAPFFAMYDEGRIVFTRKNGERVATDVAPFIVQSFVQTIMRAGFDALATSYRCDAAADRPTLRIFVRGDGGWRGASAYGIDAASCANAPAALAEACTRVTTFDDPVAKPFADAAVPEASYVARVASCIDAHARGASCD